MSKNVKKTLIAVAIVVVLALMAFLIWKQFSPQPNDGDKTLTVQVTHGDGSVKDFTLHTDAKYLWDAMDEEKLVEGKDTEYGKWVSSVDGETADEAAGQYWVFTKAGQWVEYSCDTTPIADGETYEFYIYIAE